MDCLFCKIAKKEYSSDIVFENEKVFVFKDINPKAPIHVLIIPKKHIDSINHATSEDTELMGELLLTAKKVAQTYGVAGYKLFINVGREGGQVVDHIHLHLLAELPL